MQKYFIINMLFNNQKSCLFNNPEVDIEVDIVSNIADVINFEPFFPEHGFISFMSSRLSFTHFVLVWS